MALEDTLLDLADQELVEDLALRVHESPDVLEQFDENQVFHVQDVPLLNVYFGVNIMKNCV